MPVSRTLVSTIAALSLALPQILLPNRQVAVAVEQMPNILTVSGQGIVSIPVSLAQVRLGVEVFAQTAQEAQTELEEESSALMGLLRSSNVDRLETTSLRFNPVYGSRDDERVLTGYSAQNIVSFRVDVDRAGIIVAQALEAGATRIDSISFAAADEAIEAARTNALRLATRDARTQADIILTELNLTPLEIVRIDAQAGEPPVPMLLDRNEFAATTRSAGNVSFPISGSEQQIRAFVTLQVRY
ncbi:SIMPL domain-containing protein [Oscillatoriales cyanobacterium LEGE 11467]|uniref:SIMPL domain-containing protein n=1 Tax=Zarconia navalis LEGE 11467 TaxID=1828826 RepID=A0A928Z8Q6_9CYAN|nr:SIMPL domain-containing protein [Zarconia navalis]MBE9041815.1 SIMPL domain-containing protein [Zarconia navalis LEGE 11467]